MNIEQIVQSWKNSEEITIPDAPESPVGNELSDQELSAITGGLPCLAILTCLLWGTEKTNTGYTP